MSNPRISYDTKYIDFDCFLPAILPDPMSGAVRVASSTGKRQTLLVNAETIVPFMIGGFKYGNSTDETVRRKLIQWREWAQSGLPWTFARDASKSVNTTLTAAALAGATVIQLTSTTGLTAGDSCVIRSEIHQEPVAILSIDSGVQVTLSETLNFGYPNGSRFRHADFWPAQLIDGANPIQEESNTSWRFALRFVEDTRAL